MCRNRFQAIGGAALLGIALGAGGCGKSAPKVVELPPPEVAVAQPLAEEVTEYFEFTGNTAAVKQVELRARVSGYLVKINFKDGQEVKAGEVLAEIDPRPYQATLDRAKADVARYKAELAKANADLARGKELLPSRAISRQEYDLNVAMVGIAEASIQAAEASVRSAQLDLEFTKIVAPIDGRTSKARVTEGNLIQAGTGDAGQLTTLVSTDPIYVEFNVDERSLLRYMQSVRGEGKDSRPDHVKDLKIPVQIGLANEDGFPHEGILDFADNRVDSQTGTIRCRAVFDNGKRELSPGMFTRVRMPFGPPHKALLVTDRAIASDQSQKYVLAVGAGNRVEPKQVKLGPIQAGLRVIDEGLGPDDWIVVNGMQRARPGIQVAPQKIPMPQSSR